MKSIRERAGRVLDLLTYFEIPISNRSISNFEVRRNSLPANASNIAIVVIFDTAREVDHDLLKTLRYLSEKNYAVVLVANCSPSRLVMDEVHGSYSLIVRQNVGRDFGAYKAGLIWVAQQRTLKSIDRLILFNDSVRWTPAGIEICIERAEVATHQVLGVTISRQRSEHIQSFFYLVKDGAIQFFAEKFFELKNVRFKRSIIHLGERKISKDLESIGIKFGALFDEEELRAKRKLNTLGEYHSGSNFDPVNTAIYYSKELKQLSNGITKKKIKNEI